MIYLSGCTSPRYEQAIIDLGVGLLLQPGSYKAERALAFKYFAADNGCATVKNGEVMFNPTWTCAKWARMLGAIHDLRDRRPLFVLTPDFPCDHHRTLQMFRRYSPIIRGFGFPVGFAIQNGAIPETVPWQDFDVACLGGDTQWKTEGPGWDMAWEARHRGKWIHMLRVNSWERLDYASAAGCDSSDGTFMKHGKPEDMVARIKVWLDSNQPRLTQKAASHA